MKIKIAPLRKPKESILTDDQYRDLIAQKESAIQFFAEQKGLKDHLRENTSLTGIKGEVERIPHSFSSRQLGHQICQQLQTEIVSEHKGRIADILLTVPALDEEEDGTYAFDIEERHHQTLIELLHKADERRSYTILCKPKDRNRIRGWFEVLGIAEEQYSINISLFNFTIWAQDAYVALKDQYNNPILCESVLFDRREDATIADDIAAQTNKSCLQSYLYFQGGNILEAGDYVMIGADYITDNRGRAFLDTDDKITHAFEAIFGKKVLIVGRDELIPEEHRQYLGGGYQQPIFHIDMYITPTGKTSADGKEIVFVASPRLGREAVNEAPLDTDYDEYFDEAADQLSQYFTVKRMPILSCFTRFINSNDQEDEFYYYLTYNNVLIENYEQRSNVYLPSYSQDVPYFLNDPNRLVYEGTSEKWQALDDKAQAIWYDEGFDTHVMDGLEDLTMGWGALHCITKTLVRED